MAILKPNLEQVHDELKINAKKRAGKKPAADRLTPRVCFDCERDILLGYASGIVTPIEPTLTTPAAEAALWLLGQPTYAVHRAGAKATLELRMPGAAAPVDEVAIAHICLLSERWMGYQAQHSPPWYGFDEYIVAKTGYGFQVLKANPRTWTYEQFAVCATEEIAHHAASVRNWRHKARSLRSYDSDAV